MFLIWKIQTTGSVAIKCRIWGLNCSNLQQFTSLCSRKYELWQAELPSPVYKMIWKSCRIFRIETNWTVRNKKGSQILLQLRIRLNNGNIWHSGRPGYLPARWGKFLTMSWSLSVNNISLSIKTQNNFLCRHHGNRMCWQQLRVKQPHVTDSDSCFSETARQRAENLFFVECFSAINCILYVLMTSV